MMENEIDELIESCINELSSNELDKCAKSIRSLALKFAAAGASMQSFLDMRTFIILKAKEVNSNPSLEDDLLLSEKSLQQGS